MGPVSALVMVGTLALTILAPSTTLELSPNSRPRAQGLYELELASFQGTGPGRVTTLFQSRSRELHGKNVNEDTILNVES